MSRFGNFFLTRALANAFGFKGLERDVFFALNYLNQNGSKTRSKRKTIVEQKAPDLIINCTENTFPKSIGYAFDYFKQKENRNNTICVKVYKSKK